MINSYFQDCLVCLLLWINALLLNCYIGTRDAALDAESFTTTKKLGHNETVSPKY